MDKFLKESKYKEYTADSCIYMKRVGGQYTYIAVYVDDILIASKSIVMLQDEKKLLQERFNTKDLGEAHTKADVFTSNKVLEQSVAKIWNEQLNQFQLLISITKL